MFEQASKLKIRFQGKTGVLLTVEDLWSIPLSSNTKTNLDDIYKVLRKEQNQQQEESLVDSSSSNPVLQLKIDIVKYIAKIRMEEAQAKREKATKAAQRQKIESLIEEKQDEELRSKSVEELKSLLD